MIVQPVVSRLPQRVQARRRYLLYDNACQARRYAERRYPHRVRHWTFLVDRKHWDNHTSCSTGYNMDEYPCLKKVNSQISEQTKGRIQKKKKKKKRNFLLRWVGGVSSVPIFHFFKFFFRKKHKLRTLEIAKKSL